MEFAIKEHKISKIADILPHKTRNFSSDLEIGAKLERVQNTSSGFVNSNIRDPFETAIIAKAPGYSSPGVGVYNPLKGTEFGIKDPDAQNAGFISETKRFRKARLDPSGSFGPQFLINHTGTPLLSSSGASSLRNTRGKPEDWLMPLGLPQEADARPVTPLSLKEVKKNRLEAHLAKFRKHRGGHSLLLSTINNKLDRYPANVVKTQTSTIGPGAYPHGVKWIKDQKRPSSTFSSSQRRSEPNEWSFNSIPAQPKYRKARMVESILNKKLLPTRFYDDEDNSPDGSSRKSKPKDDDTANETIMIADLSRDPQTMHGLLMQLDRIESEVCKEVKNKAARRKRRIALAMNTIRGAKTFKDHGNEKILRDIKLQKSRDRRKSPTIHKRRRPDTASKKKVRNLTRRMKRRHAKTMTRSDKEHIRREREQKHEQRTEEDHRLFTDEEDEEIEYLIHAANFL